MNVWYVYAGNIYHKTIISQNLHKTCHDDKHAMQKRITLNNNQQNWIHPIIVTSHDV